MPGRSAALLLLLFAGCKSGLTVSQLASGWVGVDVDTSRSDSPVVLQVAAPEGCPVVPAGLAATLNGVAPELRPSGGSPDGRCHAYGFVFPRSALDGAAHAVNRFELKDGTGQIVLEVIDLGRPHTFTVVDDEIAVGGRPFFIAHRGGLTPANVRGDWLGLVDGKLTKLAEAKVTVRGAAVELILPPVEVRPTQLALEWDEPVVVKTCSGVKQCVVKSRESQLITLP